MYTRNNVARLYLSRREGVRALIGEREKKALHLYIQESNGGY